ncbi:hypothetical protein HMI54_006667 [Coelomomyces lativittatus]|nr:hypothetical protein HMI56_003174 [Coelomomyces lativittatus]KAJ1517183.1 hypothetical protein HMI54_006667 [Coelomomyces lativittatus]
MESPTLPTTTDITTDITTDNIAPTAAPTTAAPAASTTSADDTNVNAPTSPSQEEPAFAVQNQDEEKADEAEPDVHFEPIVKLEPVETKTLEEDETPIFKMRGKLFRFDRAGTEWKERGIGNVRLMLHNTTGKVRVLMRREKTLKICANHYLMDSMKLQPNVDSDRSWVWNAMGDFSDGESKNEMLAIRFANAECCILVSFIL